MDCKSAGGGAALGPCGQTNKLNFKITSDSNYLPPTPVAKPPPKAKAKTSSSKDQENRAPTPLSDAFREQIEQKYNIEGCNVGDIVFARIENDAANATIADQKRELEAQKKRSEDLQRQIDKLLARAPAPVVPIEDQAGEDGVEVNDATAALERENAELKKQLAKAKTGSAAAGAAGVAEPREPTPRPTGTAGTHFSIIAEMRLDSNRQDRAQFSTIQRNLRELFGNSRINWELPWAQVPAAAKAQLFAIARKHHPYLAEFQNDWATEEIVKQYVKNKRNNAYKKGYIDVPPKYAYLKENAAKRDPSKPRGKKASKPSKSGAIRADAAKDAQRRKARQPADRSRGESSKAKGKRAVRNIITSDDEDDQMADVDVSGARSPAGEDEWE
ncbi:hypothetical protein GGX14DRAFT_456951 [Mycena pura]|uniref:Uncharacterized protein n=1 Tax=Mycena pura TaxID=153505 RepID=A0AAD6Y8B2_9AGAR|nr:hypothetical protein GGX14DRAFT_456951 [Mycena pura]